MLMSDPTAHIRAALAKVIDPELRRPITELDEGAFSPDVAIGTGATRHENRALHWEELGPQAPRNQVDWETTGVPAARAG